MYNQSSKYYDIAYGDSNYEGESDWLIKFINEQNSESVSLLNLACGSGNHDGFLSHRFEVSGLDINPFFIDVAKSKNPDVKYYRADMTQYNLNRKFDVITCLFSSIANLDNVESLRSMIECSLKHLNPNGILVIEPFFEPSQWTDGLLIMRTFDSSEYKYSILSKSKLIDGKGAATEYHTYIDAHVEDSFSEEFTFSLFTKDEIKEIFIQAGFLHNYYENELFPRGLHVGVIK